MGSFRCDSLSFGGQPVCGYRFLGLGYKPGAFRAGVPFHAEPVPMSLQVFGFHRSDGSGRSAGRLRDLPHRLMHGAGFGHPHGDILL
jgi:hypothetical protein